MKQKYIDTVVYKVQDILNQMFSEFDDDDDLGSEMDEVVEKYIAEMMMCDIDEMLRRTRNKES